MGPLPLVLTALSLVGTAISPINGLENGRLDCSVGSRPNGGGSPSVVLGCARTDDGDQIQLSASGAGAGPCLEIIWSDRQGSRGCGRAPLERVPPKSGPLTFDGTAQPDSLAPIEVYGGTSRAVQGVVVDYRVQGLRGSADAALISVIDRRALRRAQVERRFGYFVAEVPPGVRHCRATALGAGGRELSAKGCDPYDGLAADAFILGSR